MRTARAVRNAVYDGVIHHADDRIDGVGLDFAHVAVILYAGVARDFRRVNAGLVKDIIENDAQILTLDACVRVEKAGRTAAYQTERIGGVYICVVGVAEIFLARGENRLAGQLLVSLDGNRAELGAGDFLACEAVLKRGRHQTGLLRRGDILLRPARYARKRTGLRHEHGRRQRQNACAANKGIWHRKDLLLMSCLICIEYNVFLCRICEKHIVYSQLPQVYPHRLWITPVRARPHERAHNFLRKPNKHTISIHNYILSPQREHFNNKNRISV